MIDETQERKKRRKVDGRLTSRTNEKETKINAKEWQRI